MTKSYWDNTPRIHIASPNNREAALSGIQNLNGTTLSADSIALGISIKDVAKSPSSIEESISDNDQFLRPNFVINEEKGRTRT
jgi:hypothetical protein